MFSHSIKRNTPVRTLISDYLNKNSGKVWKSRNELCSRFDYLDRKDQKRILEIFLNSNKVDRNWAYTKVMSFGDDSFIMPIVSLWDKYQEDNCAKLIREYFPVVNKEAYKSSIRRNTTVRTLINNYTDKQSGKVTDSRNEIRARFNYLDWKVQKQILMIFLNSNKADRNWAYKKLRRYGDETFIPLIESLWEKYHEDNCIKVVIALCPDDFLMKYQEELGKGRNYFFLCMRLCYRKDFIINEKRLSRSDRLMVMRYLGEIDDYEFYSVIENMSYHERCYDADGWYRDWEKNKVAEEPQPIINDEEPEEILHRALENETVRQLFSKLDMELCDPPF